MARPLNPSYTVPFWATTANYPAGSSPWSGTPTKATHPSPQGGFVPGQGAAAEYMNKLLHDAFDVDASAKAAISTLTDYVGQMNVLVYSKNALTATAADATVPVWDAVSRRWVTVGGDSGAKPFYSFDGKTWVVGSFTGNPSFASLAVNPAGLAVFIGNNDNAWSLAANTNTWTYPTVPAGAQAVHSATVWLSSASLFVSCGQVSPSASQRSATSNGTANWVDRTANIPATVAALTGCTFKGAASASTVVMLPGTSGNVNYMTSTDGINWTLRATLPVVAGEATRCITYATTSSLFVMITSVTATGIVKTYTSPDGVTWTLKSTTVSQNWVPFGIVTMGTIWAMAAGAGVGTATSRATVLYSLDLGVTWRPTDAYLPYPLTAGDLRDSGISTDGERLMLGNNTAEVSVSSIALGTRTAVT